ncbi:37122_t:CDS:1 [Racocetra persica]|uniref:37122_t:CDS:1 n=1 Tax=Racocetra persica TaxID=160502 RepID=A0ACA9KJB6_9GLOM|nr:37122_t:CDS:1 [Racocetra persica]
MTFSLMMKSEVQFMNVYENSLDNELFRNPPYPLAMKIEELILPPKNSRKATKNRKKPYSTPPPRPQNSWVLFRRNFTELHKKSKGTKITNSEISRLAAEEWRNQPGKVRQFFEILETFAKEKHKEAYPGYQFRPKKKEKPKSKKIHHNKCDIIQFQISQSHNEVTKPEETSINCADNFSEYFNTLEASENIDFNFPYNNDFHIYNDFYFYTPNFNDHFNDLEMLNNSFFQQTPDQTSDQDYVNFSDYIIDPDFLT